jgi:hypothetical protein
MVRAVLFQYHTWTFNRQRWPQEIAAYIDVSSATMIDVDSGQINAASTSITALSVTIPNGHSADHLIAVFVKPFLLK